MIEIVKDLIKKYNIFLKYLFVAGVSFFIDISFFTIFNSVLNIKIIVATILARIISSFINYLLNRKKVFNSKEGKLKTVIKYYCLVVAQLFVSALLVDNIHKLININATFIKIPVEFILFMCNYFIQKFLIFKRGKNENDKE